jgi:hypothetical protein
MCRQVTEIGVDAVTSRYDGEALEHGERTVDPWEGVDAAALARAVRAQAGRPVAGIDDMASYLADQVSDASHREVIGPLLDGHGASGVVVRAGTVLASWGDPMRAEMAYSATKSVLRDAQEAVRVPGRRRSDRNHRQYGDPCAPSAGGRNAFISGKTKRKPMVLTDAEAD